MKHTGVRPKGPGVVLRTPACEVKSAGEVQGGQWHCCRWVPWKMPLVETEVGKARKRKPPGSVRIHGPPRETRRSKTAQELRLVADSPRQHARGRDRPLEMVRNHFKSWAGQTRWPEDEGRGRAEGATGPATAGTSGTGRGRERQQRGSTPPPWGHPDRQTDP